MKSIGVYLRRSTGTGLDAHLCDVPYEQIEEVVKTLSRWGVYDIDEGVVYTEAVGQFVYNAKGDSFFEVILPDDDET